jgi:ABC-type multidrug transport system fused ATPase/permease subunit
MRSLIKVISKFPGYLRWLFFCLITIVGVTVANQMEIVLFGIVVNNGADFFKLFGDGFAAQKSGFEEKWNQIDVEGKGEITQFDATRYLSNRKDEAFVKRIFHGVKLHFIEAKEPLKEVIKVVLVVAIFKMIFLYMSRYMTKAFGIKVSRALRQRYFEHIQELPMSFYHRFDMGMLTTRIIGDSNQVALSINSWVINCIQAPLTVIGAMSLCFFFSWKLSCIFILAAPIIFFLIRILTKMIRKQTIKLQKSQESFASILIDFLAGIQTVKVFNVEKFVLGKYKKESDRIENFELKMAKYDALKRPLLHTITTYSAGAILFFGLYFFHMPLPELMVYLGCVFLVYEPIRRYSDESMNVQRGIVAAERILEILDIQSDIADLPGAKDLGPFQEAVSFENVSFRYENDWVLQDISFTVRKGETVAIVGPTGSGKTTILQLLPRLYDVTEGDIKIDGHSVRSCTIRSVRSLLAYVPQRPFLFNDTIRENILFGQDLPDSLLIDVCKQAEAHDFIMELPNGYDSQVSEMGKNLSGGQQQRIAIARALAKGASLLILDEATSALDSVSEKKIQCAIENLKGSVTQIIVAHRLSTIEHADRIIFLSRGKIEAMGTKGELLETCPLFRDTWEAGTLSAF